MHHPGPPRFTAAGRTLELAPTDPDPDATYRWRVESAPLTSDVSLGDDPVEFITPDAPGTYVVELDAPDGTHRQTIRAFPGELAPAGTGGGVSGMSGFASGSARPTGQSGDVTGSGSGAGSGGGDGGGRPRIQLHGAVEGDTVVIRADPQTNPNSNKPRESLDVEFLVDDRDDLSQRDVTVDGWELRIPVSALPKLTRVHAVAVGESYSVPDAVAIERGEISSSGRVDVEGHSSADADADISIVRLNDPPAWSTDVTLYEIYVRGFASDDEEADNTFEALTKRLDYLEELGVDCLWLTPVLQNDDAPHGYNITDFFDIAEDLGTREEYEKFVDAAHDHGMKVLFDLVLNHSARQHPFYEDAYKNPESEYYDWYEWQESGEPGTYFDWEKIANFDFTNLEVRRHLLDAVDTWAEIADGFRCDMAWAVSRPFWTELHERLKTRDPEFLLLDETIPYIADFHDLAFDMHFDTTLYFTLRQVGRGAEPAEAILDAVEQRTEVGFPDHASFMLYLENHDETRYIVECGDPEAYAAGAALFTLPGVPMLYGGQELGQLGRRDALAWEHANEDLRAYYESLIDTRNETDALRYDGEFSRIDYEAESDRVVAFAREDGQKYVVALNFGAEPAPVEFGVSVENHDVVSGERLEADEHGLYVDHVAVLPVDE
ncbi:alpha-amylase [Haloprofundus marisrubri]|uniref:Alpha-amylase n=1 Tax=Haloprofundus marisrubri TaxID=1514971 RepID=A0A0W1RCK7_9EURY|nr:alpha-amylase MalA [Haloprofundus marisrubri]KTG11216.1 alpha-amylase [Haloprofundus marisrubri]